MRRAAARTGAPNATPSRTIRAHDAAADRLAMPTIANGKKRPTNSSELRARNDAPNATPPSAVTSQYCPDRQREKKRCHDLREEPYLPRDREVEMDRAQPEQECNRSGGSSGCRQEAEAAGFAHHEVRQQDRQRPDDCAGEPVTRLDSGSGNVG